MNQCYLLFYQIVNSFVWPPNNNTQNLTDMKNLLFLTSLIAFSWLGGCSQKDNAVPVQLSATEKLIQKKWSLSGLSIRTDKAATYGLTKDQWQKLGVDLDNLAFRADGRYSSSSGAAGTYTLKQDDTVLELTNEPYPPFIFYELTVYEYEFRGQAIAVAVNPEKAGANQAEKILASYGLKGLALFREVDVSKVKTVQLLFTYTAL